ncbi:hypothetical protein AHAS_Ahas13G0349000 [Arachis hypogaea]
MDGPLILLFVWAWERMPLLAPIPRDQLGDVGPSAPPRTQLFDLNECPQEEEDVLGDDVQHCYDLGGASAPGVTGSWICDTGSSSMTDFGGLDAELYYDLLCARIKDVPDYPA